MGGMMTKAICPKCGAQAIVAEINNVELTFYKHGKPKRKTVGGFSVREYPRICQVSKSS
jgi:hypothetical protein